MQLDPHIAQDLVDNFKAITKHEINLFNVEGRIVASTDASRVGQLHEGARRAAATMESLRVEHDDGQSGMRRGVNVPIIFQNAAVAVIGITGDPCEVGPFATVIMKMAQILLRENWKSLTMFNRRSNLSNLASLITLPHYDTDYASYLASLLNIDLARPRCVVIGSARTTDGRLFDFEDQLFTLNALLQDSPQSFFSISNARLLLFVDEGTALRIVPALASIRDALERQNPGLTVRFGAGSFTGTALNYHESYMQAEQASQFAFFSNEQAITRYEDLDIGMVLTSIPGNVAHPYVEKVFGHMSDRDLDYYQTIFDSYTAHNGSIIRSAGELALHKNTLQNKLNKLGKLTGYNPRELSGFPVLWLAFALRRYQALIQDDNDRM